MRLSSSMGVNVRLAFICALFGGCALVLVWRMFSLQVRDVSRYQQLADDERRAQIPIVPRRGSLIDTNGNPLAVSVEYDSVYVLGPMVEDPDAVAAALSPILGLPAADIRADIDKDNNQPVVLKSQVPSAVSSQVTRLNLEGVY